MVHLDDSLVTTEWLQQNLGAEDLSIIDIRGYVKSRDLGGGKKRHRTQQATTGDHASPSCATTDLIQSRVASGVTGHGQPITAGVS